jgi:tetratricopeptide (TPR) repeat protein
MSASNVSGDSFYDDINRACDRFEAEWRSGRQPKIELYVVEAPEGARSELIRELLKLDIYYRKDRGDTILPGDYSGFAEHASLIDELLGPCLLPESPSELTYAGRYRLEGRIGRGGMGEVFRAHDPDFRRPLAVKILKEEFKDRADLVARFREEAQITGQLQHPGVPPVHQFGRLPDGRPFLAMKLIEGRTLAYLLTERKSVGQVSNLPQTREASWQPAPQDLPRFLTIFEHICQTVAYAHSRRVIHRDLKPANVMVGAFGEVQVMDWGLAKVLSGERSDRDSSEKPESNTLQTPGPDAIVEPAARKTVLGTCPRRTSSQGTVESTVRSDVLGTLAYMPPEQACGQVSRVNERSDVFSLGAILCEILTGAPPYREALPERAWLQARQADLADAFGRLDSCSADAELIALAKRCLESEMGLRPDNADEVAKAVAAYQAEVQERLRKAELERAAAEVKAREGRRRVRLTVALAASVLALVVFAGVAAWWYQHEQFARETERAVRKAQTEAVVPAALSEFQTRLEEAREPTNDPKLRLARVRSAWSAVKRAEEQLAGGEGSEELAEQVRQSRAVVEEELLDSELLAELDRIRLEQAAVVTQGHFDYARVIPRYAAAVRTYGVDVSAPDRAGARVRASRQREVLLSALEDWARNTNDDERRKLEALLRAAEPAPDAFRARWRAALRDGPALAALAGDKVAKDLPAEGIFHLAIDLQGAGELAAMEQLLRRGQERYPNEFWLNHELGMVLMKLRPSDDDGAVRYFTAALALRSESPGALVNLGLALRAKKDFEGAIRCCRKAIELDPEYAMAHNNLGLLLHDTKNLEGAIRCFHKALELDPSLAMAHCNLGNALKDLGNPEEAIRCYHKAIELDPKLVQAHYNLGLALKEKKQLEEAIRCYDQALKLDPHYAIAHHNLGNALLDKGNLEGAIRCFRKALDLDPKLAMAHNGLGGILCDWKSDFDGAISHFQGAQALEPTNAMVYFNLGNAWTGKGNPEEATRCYRTAIRLDPKFASAYYGLGISLNAKGDLEGAIRSYRSAIKCDPNHAEAHCNLGRTLRDMGKFADAQLPLKHGHELGSQRNNWRYPSPEWVRECTRFVDLDPRLPAFLKGDLQPSTATERFDLASLCQLPCKRLHAAAARFYAEAFASEPNLAENLQTWHRYNAARTAVLASAGQAADAARLDDQERTRLRKQALDWLRADLTAWTKLADDANEHSRIRQTLQYWEKDADFASIREPAAVANLPNDEQEACKKLWADVAALLKKVEKIK